MLSSSGQLRSRSGLVQYRLKFNYFELDSEVGQIVVLDFNYSHKMQVMNSQIFEANFWQTGFELNLLIKVWLGAFRGQVKVKT